MCIFCQIINKEIDSDLVFENDELIAFKDLNPRAKTHLLIVPKKHIDSIKDIDETAGDDALVGRMILAAKNLAKERDLEGYQLQFHVGEKGGQIIFHIHLHLMSNQ
jgi:histidine triad (HIT) family protein